MLRPFIVEEVHWLRFSVTRSDSPAANALFYRAGYYPPFFVILMGAN